MLLKSLFHQPFEDSFMPTFTVLFFVFAWAAMGSKNEYRSVSVINMNITFLFCRLSRERRYSAVKQLFSES